MTANATNTFTTSLIVPKALQRSAPKVEIRYSDDYVLRPFNFVTPIRSFDFLERPFGWDLTSMPRGPPGGPGTEKGEEGEEKVGSREMT